MEGGWAVEVAVLYEAMARSRASRRSPTDAAPLPATVGGLGWGLSSEALVEGRDILKAD